MIKLNLGCGQDYREGWVNADVRLPNIYNKYNKNKIDKEINLELFPYPFKDNEFDYIYCYHVLEHIGKLNMEDFFNEIWRILKPHGTINISVPHFSSWNAYAFDHKRFFNIRDFISYVPILETNQGNIKTYKLIKAKLHSRCYSHSGGKTNLKINITIEGLYNLYNKIIDGLANINPILTERFWCYWVGGFAEMNIIYEKN